MIATSHTLCTGCGACLNICPIGAIKLKPNADGFLFPQVGEGCIKCGRCVNVCPIQHPLPLSPALRTYALQCSEETMAEGSALAVLVKALYARSKHSVVFGPKIDPSSHVIQDSAAREKACVPFYGFKKTQSETRRTFQQVKFALTGHAYVLYFGTPCQIGGLKSYLESAGCERDKLLLVDLSCPGVVSPLSDAARRPSCASCTYAGQERVSDLTLADLREPLACNPAFSSERPVSLVLENSQKGLDFLAQVRPYCVLCPIPGASPLQTRHKKGTCNPLEMQDRE